MRALYCARHLQLDRHEHEEGGGREPGRSGVGEAVELESIEGTGAKSNLLVFGIPVLLMVAGVMVGGLALRKDLWSGILAGVGLAMGLGIVKVIDASVNRSGRSLPVVVRRLSADEIRSQKSECRSENGGNSNESADNGSAGGSLDNGVR